MKKRNAPKGKSRRAKPAPPQIFVLTTDDTPARYARASIRVKAGQYCYLVWREGNRVRNFYLGKRREA